MCVCSVAKLCPTLCSPIDCSLPGSSAHGIPGKNTGASCHFLHQGIFLTQGSNSRLLHWQICSLPLSHQNLPANVGDAGLIPGSEISPGEENGNPLQYSCLGNPMDRRTWWATVHRVTKESNMT